MAVVRWSATLLPHYQAIKQTPRRPTYDSSLSTTKRLAHVYDTVRDVRTRPYPNPRGNERRLRDWDV